MNLFGYSFNLTRRNDTVFNSNQWDFSFLKSDKVNKKELLKLGYEENIDAYSVVKKIVDVSKSIEWIVEEKTNEGWVVMQDNTITPLLENPNPIKGYTWQDIQEQFLTYLLCSGNAFLFGEKLDDKGGLIMDLDVLPSTHVEIKCNDSFFINNVEYKFRLGNTSELFNNEELAHVKLFNPSFTTVKESLNGLSAFQVAHNVIKVGNDKWDADSHLLQNRGIAGIISDNSERPMTPAEAKKAQLSFDRESTGTSKFGRIRVSNKNLKYIQMGMSSSDLELVKKGVITLRAMCNVFGLDSSLFNDPANKTFNNRLEAEKSLYTNAIIPLSNKLASSFTRYICYNHYPNKNVRMRQDFSKVEALQKDKKSEAEKDKIVMDGVNVILNMPISIEGKKELLITNYDFTEEQADTVLAPAGKGNKAIEVLSSISPLLATKLIESLSDEERKDLLN